MPWMSSMQRADADIILDQAVILPQLRTRAAPYRAPSFEEQYRLGEIEGRLQPLFHQNDRHVSTGCEERQRFHQFIADDGGQTLEGLIEKEQRGATEDSSRSRKHLLFAARQLPAEVPPTLLEPRKHRIGLLDHISRPVLDASEQIFLHGERAKDISRLRHE